MIKLRAKELMWLHSLPHWLPKTLDYCEDLNDVGNTVSTAWTQAASLSNPTAAPQPSSPNQKSALWSMGGIFGSLLICKRVVLITCISAATGQSEMPSQGLAGHCYPSRVSTSPMSGASNHFSHLTLWTWVSFPRVSSWWSHLYMFFPSSQNPQSLEWKLSAANCYLGVCVCVCVCVC